MNCFHSFRTENEFKPNKKLCQNKDLCGTVMSSEKDKILEFKEYMKSDKMTYTEYLILKIDGRANNPDKS